MAVHESGNSTPGQANVSATFQAMVAVDDDSSRNGILAITGRADDGTYTGAPTDIDVEVDQDFRMRVGQDSLLFRERWDGAALNPNLWTNVATTQTLVIGAGYATLNAGASVAANGVCRVQSYQTFPLVQSMPLAIKVPFKVIGSSVGIAQTAWAFGIGYVTGVAAPMDGVELSMSTAGVLTLQSFYNSSAANAVTLTTPVLSPGVDYNATIVINQGSAQVWINDFLCTPLSKPSNIPTLMLSTAAPFYARTFVSASGAASATGLALGQVTITVGGVANPLTMHEAALYMGGTSAQGQSGLSAVSTSRAVATGAAPTPAVPTNTTAALGTGLGGDFASTNTLAVNTYGIISSFPVPAAGLGLHSKALHIRRVRIDTSVLAVLANAAAANYVWAIAWGHTAVSLATANGITSRAPVLQTVGQQVAIGAAAAGLQLATIETEVNIVVQPGEFIQAIMKNAGTVGTGGTLLHTIHFTGKWL